MSLLEHIEMNMRNAMKVKDVVARDTLRVLMGEIGRIPTTKDYEIPDEEVVPIIKKMIENIKETSSENWEREIEVLNVFMPHQLSEAQIEELLMVFIKEEGITSMRDMGKVMNYFKNEYFGQYDGRTLSAMVKRHLSS